MRTSSYMFALAIVCSIASLSSCDERDSSDKVVLITPVLAPQRGPRAKTETAKDFPLLTLFAKDDNAVILESEPINEDVQPIYVKKLEKRSIPGHIVENNIHVNH